MKIVDDLIWSFRLRARERKIEELKRNILSHYYGVERHKLEIEMAEEKLKQLEYGGYKKDGEEEEIQENPYSQTNNGKTI